MSPVTLVEAVRVAPTRWRNGGGLTRELLVVPAPAASGAAWRLRVSVAEIALDGPFSAFPGITRWFAVIDGAGVDLVWPDHRQRQTQAAAPLRFDGGTPPECALVAGPTRDLNLMVDGRFGAIGLHRAAAGVARAGRRGPRGLFTGVAARLHRDGHPPQALPRDSLLWCGEGERRAWTLEPLAEGPLFWIDEAF